MAGMRNCRALSKNEHWHVFEVSLWCGVLFTALGFTLAQLLLLAIILGALLRKVWVQLLFCLQTHRKTFAFTQVGN